MENYEFLMQKCIELAKKGRGKVSPNPMVGCVVLNKNNDIISEGYHSKYGENHAERDALLKIKDGSDKDGTIIVNLEPCSHWGKTPPCVDLIIERGLKKVVIACVDNNPKVNGKGIKKLKDAGIEVVTGVLEKESRALNEVFFTNVEQKRLFIALKTATTIDGKISTFTGDSKWITSELARDYGKELRNCYDAILTSSSTVLADNPQMLHKLKIILDKDFKTGFDMDIYKTGKILLVTTKSLEEIPQNVKIITPIIIDNKIDLADLSKKLYDLNIKSIFVEAGGILSGEFVKKDLVDKIYQFIGPKIVNDNSAKSCFSADNISKIVEAKKYRIVEMKQIGDDGLIVYKKD